MSEALNLLWERVGQEGGAVDGQDVAAWADRALPALLEAGVLEEIESARTFACDACGRGHIESVFVIPGDGDIPARTFIRCPENGRVSVDAALLRRWVVRPARIAAAVGRLLKTQEVGVEEVVRGRLWMVGAANWAGRPREVFFARGLGWPDGGVTISAAPRLLSSAAPVILVPDHSNAKSEAGTRIYLPLGDITRLDRAELALDLKRIEERLVARGPGMPLASPKVLVACALVRELGCTPRWLDLDSDEREALRGKKGQFTIFADEATRTVRKRKGPKAETRTASLSHFRMIRRAAEARKPYDPATDDDETGTAGKQTFQRARQVFDIRKPNRDWALFKTSKIDQVARYQLIPDEAISFAFIFARDS